MQQLPPPPALEVTNTALFLDIDGTLAEFAATPEQVGPEPRRTLILRRLVDRLDGRVAALSGRSLQDIDRILEGSVGPAGAVHGLVQRLPSGAVEEHAVGRLSDGLRTAVGRFAAAAPGLIVEDKGAGVALHYRSCPQLKAEIDEFAPGLAREFGLQLQRGSFVVELRPPGPDKGAALTRLMQSPPFAGATPVMIGDDLTDEHAFEAASAGDGFGVIVGPRRPTTAKFGLRDVASVLGWLERT